jgi:Zn-dependent protease
MINVLFLLSLSLIAHETGHFICAKIFKSKILTVKLFWGTVFYIWIKGILFKIGLVPILANISVPGIYKIEKWKQIIFYLSGITMNAVLYFIGNEILQTINLYLLIFNLLPFASSDGRKIFQILFNK